MFTREDSYVRNHTSSERATTIRHRAGLKGEPIGEPRIWWNTAVPMENWVMSKEARMIGSTSRM